MQYRDKSAGNMAHNTTFMAHNTTELRLARLEEEFSVHCKDFNKHREDQHEILCEVLLLQRAETDKTRELKDEVAGASDLSRQALDELRKYKTWCDGRMAFLHGRLMDSRRHNISSQQSTRKGTAASAIASESAPVKSSVVSVRQLKAEANAIDHVAELEELLTRSEAARHMLERSISDILAVAEQTTTQLVQDFQRSCLHAQTSVDADPREPTSLLAVKSQGLQDQCDKLQMHEYEILCASAAGAAMEASAEAASRSIAISGAATTKNLVAESLEELAEAGRKECELAEDAMDLHFRRLRAQSSNAVRLDDRADEMTVRFEELRDDLHRRFEEQSAFASDSLAKQDRVNHASESICQNLRSDLELMERKLTSTIVGERLSWKGNLKKFEESSCDISARVDKMESLFLKNLSEVQELGSEAAERAKA